MFWNKKWIDHGPRNKTWYHVTSWRILGCPDDSLKIHGDEKVHFGHPGISGKWLEWRILWSWAATPSFRKFDRKICLSNWFEVVDMTNVRQNSTAFLADISLLEGRMGTDIRETLTFLMCEDSSPHPRLFLENVKTLTEKVPHKVWIWLPPPLFLKNVQTQAKKTAYGGYRISRPMQIVGPIQFWRGCVIYLKKNIYINIY